MLEFVTNRFGKTRRIDVHNLPIAKTYAHKLPGPDLCRELQKLGIEGLTPTMSHQDMSLIYGNWLAEQQEAAKQ